MMKCLLRRVANDLHVLRMNPNSSKFHWHVMNLSRDLQASEDRILWLNLATEFFHSKAAKNRNLFELGLTLQAFRLTDNIYPLLYTKVSHIVLDEAYKDSQKKQDLLFFLKELARHPEVAQGLESSLLDKLSETASFAELAHLY